MNFSLTRVRLTAAVLLALCVVLLALTLLGVGGPVRLLCVVAVGLSAPGWALVAFLPAMRLALEWALAVAFSLAASVVLATTLLTVGWWRPQIGFFTLVAATSCLLTWHLLRPANRMVGILEVADDMIAVGPVAGAGTLGGRTRTPSVDRRPPGPRHGPH